MDRRSLATRVYQELKRDIIRCELRPAQPLYEGELAERYAVSKTPIREALNTLRQEGYIEVIPRRGYVVRPVSIQDVQHILHLRLLLEPSAAELAAQRITGDQLRNLRRMAQRRVGPSRGQQLTFDRGFHQAVADASGNPRLAACIGKQLEEIERVYHLCKQIGRLNADRPNYHLALVDALVKGDAPLARETMIEAVQCARKEILEALLSADADAQTPVLVGSADFRPSDRLTQAASSA